MQIEGAGTGSTTLLFNSTPPADRQFDIQLWGPAQNIEIDSLTFEYGDAGTGTGALVDAAGSQNLLFDNVDLIANNIDPLDLEGAANVTVENSLLEGGPVQALGVHDLFFNNNTIQEAYAAEEGITLGDSMDVSLTNTSVGNLNNSITDSYNGSGQSRFIEYNTDFGPTTNQYIAGNTTLLGQPYQGNSGEQILCEGGTQAIGFSGAPASVTADTFTITVPHNQDPSDNSIYAGEEVVVTDGPGIAQMRTVQSDTDAYDASASTDTITITLNQAWTVQPTTSSHITVSNLMSNAVFYQNTLRDLNGTAGAAKNAAASTGILVQGYGLFVDDNTLMNLRDGIRVGSSVGLDNPTFFEEVINNTIDFSAADTGPMNYQSIGIAMGASVVADTEDTNFIGTTIRNNTISGTPIGINLNWQSLGSDTLTVVEDNSVTSQFGIVICDDPDTLVRDNTFTSSSNFSTTPAAVIFDEDNQSNSPTALMQDNVYDNYGATDIYTAGTGASIPASLLPIP
jgi:hypothetical protein